MFHSPVPDVIVGLLFAYVMLSLVCTVLNEWIVALTRLRARSLRRAVLRLLDDPATGLGTALYGHALIDCLTQAGRGCPAYLEPRVVAAVLADLMVGPYESPAAWQRALRALPPCRLRRTLLVLLAGAPPGEAELRIAAWFESAMLPLTAWYRRRLQLISCGVALGLCVALDADTTRLARALWGSAPGAWHGPGRVAGWLLTSVAVSRGAPFWFDVLNRVSGARAARR